VMPGMDGYEAIRRIKALTAPETVKIIIVSASSLNVSVPSLSPNPSHQGRRSGIRNSSPNPLLLEREGGSCSPSLSKRGGRGVSSEWVSLTSSELKSTVLDGGTGVQYATRINPGVGLTRGSHQLFSTAFLITQQLY
jgi:hypothetical protein